MVFDHSRGFQCIGNALCMLSYSTCFEIDSSSTLDKVLYDADALYQTTINNLKADGKFINSLLSLDEIPDIFEIWIGKFIVEKQHTVSSILVDTHEEHGLPTLHYVLNLALTSMSSGLITIGAICSTVFKKKDLYFFFILILMDKMDFNQLLVPPLSYLSQVWMILFHTCMLFMTA